MYGLSHGTVCSIPFELELLLPETATRFAEDVEIEKSLLLLTYLVRLFRSMSSQVATSAAHCASLHIF